MSSAAKAYARVAETTASPREIEAQLLMKAATRLQNIKDNWESARSDLIPALHYNRKIWSVFTSAALRDDNPQSIEVRQNIANIGVFVMRHTIDIEVASAPEKLGALIDINRNIAAGLRGRG